MYIHTAYVRADVIIHTRNAHRRRQVTVAPARRTDSRRVLLDNAPVDGRTDERTDAHIPVIVLSQEEARACPIGFVSTRFLSKDVSYTISITCHIPLSFLPALASSSVPVLLFSMLFARRRVAPYLFGARMQSEKRNGIMVKSEFAHYRALALCSEYILYKDIINCV